MKKIALDMMGSDLGPEELIKSLVDALKEDDEYCYVLFGDEEILSKYLDDPIFKDRVEIRDYKDIIPMEVKPLEFLRKKESSMYQAIASVRDEECQAVVSAGSTGGFVTGCTFILRNIPGVIRAALCSQMPSLKSDNPKTILDIGANNNNTPDELYQYAVMGKIFAKDVLGIDNTTVALLSNGQEEGKGREEIVQAYKLIKEKGVDGFIGNIEARDVLTSPGDVIVCSGFDGNVLIKSIEGTASSMSIMLKKAFKRNILSKLGYLFVKKGIKEMKDKMDYRKYGGAILLGIDGVAIKAHGSSNALAFYNAIRVAKRMVENQIVDKIKGVFDD